MPVVVGDRQSAVCRGEGAVCPSLPFSFRDDPVSAVDQRDPVAIIGRIARPGHPDVVYRSLNSAPYSATVQSGGGLPERQRFFQQSWICEAALNCPGPLVYNGRMVLTRSVIYRFEQVAEAPGSYLTLTGINLSWPDQA